MEKIHRFNNVITDGLSCILLGDLHALKRFQEENGLPANLQTPFTSSDHGDNVVDCGAMAYLTLEAFSPLIFGTGYTVYFNFSEKSVFRTSSESEILHDVSGNLLHVVSGKIHMYGWSCLDNFSPEKIAQSQQFPSVACDNGYYDVQVISGYLDGWAAFEFILKPSARKKVGGDIGELADYVFSFSD